MSVDLFRAVGQAVAVTGWTSVDLTMPVGVEPMALDILAGALHERGVAGIETRETSDQTTIVASFSDAVSPDILVACVEPALREAGLTPSAIKVRTEAPVDWGTHWRRNFRSLKFGPLWVVPTWLTPPEEADAVIRLDPGMAFGTGHHETTALCLERIGALRPRQVLDVGTGTGILALGALRLGAAEATGTDNDPDALVVAGENAALNGLAEALTLSAAEPDALGTRFELVVANILRDPLIGLAPAIRRAVRPGGTVVLSGLLVEQVEAVREAYEATGLTLVGVRHRGEWALVELCAAD